MPFYNFGLEGFVGSTLYGVAILVFFLSVFWRPIIGLYCLVPLIPLQTIRYRLNEYPLGGSFVAIIIIGVVLGLLHQKRQVVPRTPFVAFLGAYGGYLFLSLCAGALYLGRSFVFDWGDPRFSTWRDYIIMMLLVPVIASAVTTSKEIKIIIVLMCLGTLALDKSFYSTVADRDYSSYSEDLRDDSGVSGQAGLNGLAAFTAQSGILLMSLAGFERRRSLRLGYYALAVYSALCLMYSLSRGGYAAFLAGCVFLGVVKQRKLLVVLCVLALVWTTVLPQAVQDRVLMTYDDGELDHSSQTRMFLWQDALDVLGGNAATGTGYETYAYMEHLGNYKDTHNIYIKVLVETGFVGLGMFLALLGVLLKTGWRLFRRAENSLLASVGLGLAGWVVCSAVANFFGDRWSFLQVNGYMWVLAGLAIRGWAIEQGSRADESEDVAVAEIEMSWLPDGESSPA